ncbi:MAG: hypothetical protein ACHP85_00420 [Burkholderiales bacterium]|jgi:hypothetical protein
MRVKVRDGTVNHGDTSLCSSCRHAIVTKGSRLGEEFVRCGVRWQLVAISFRVTSCSEYLDRALPALEDMEEIAWSLRSTPSGKKVGFVEARRLAEGEPEVSE